MDREKKIAFIKGQLRNAEDDLNEAIVQKDDYFATRIEYFVSLLKRELKLLSLPKRTLETLEIGDYIKLYTNEKIYVGATMRNNFDLFQIKNDYNAYQPCEITIIPHEALELLKELIGNETV